MANDSPSVVTGQSPTAVHSLTKPVTDYSVQTTVTIPRIPRPHSQAKCALRRPSRRHSCRPASSLAATLQQRRQPPASFYLPRAARTTVSRRLICGLRSIASLVRFVRLAWSVTDSHSAFISVLLTNTDSSLRHRFLRVSRCTLVSTSDPLVSALLRSAAGTLGPVAVIVKSCVSQSPVTPSLPTPLQQGSHCCSCHLHRQRSRFTLSPTSS